MLLPTDILKEIKAFYFPYVRDYHTYEYLSEKGCLEGLKWVYTHNPEAKCSTHAMDNAAKNGHLDVVKWLHENRIEGCTDDAMEKAAENGHYEIVKWLYKNRCEGCIGTSILSAYSNKHYQIVTWLYEKQNERYMNNSLAFIEQFLIST